MKENGNHCIEVDTAEKEGIFSEDDNNFETILYVDTAAASTFACRGV